MGLFGEELNSEALLAVTQQKTPYFDRLMERETQKGHSGHLPALQNEKGPRLSGHCWRIRIWFRGNVAKKKSQRLMLF